MKVRDEAADLREDLWDFVLAAAPLARSLTGNGVRRTLRLFPEELGLEIHEIPTGTEVLDWTVPREWNLERAWIRDPHGTTVVDTRDHLLHVVGYSTPIQTSISLGELQNHLHSLPDQPDLIPYRTSYYKETWGFCLPHRQREALMEGDYEVLIDSTLEPGALSYGEIFLPGAEDTEFLISTHVCHPAMANDNLSGIAVSLGLARILAAREDRRFGYRFVFVPGTLGSISWLARNRKTVGRIGHGLVAANLGDPGAFHYKRSRRGNATIDRAVERVLADRGLADHITDFVPFGYDERQYCSPGFDLPVGLLSRTPWGQYPQYHTSADDLDFISSQRLAESVSLYLDVIDVVEANRCYRNLAPHGEPQLGRRGLYRSLGGDDRGRERELALLWLLNLSDGDHDLLAIAERSNQAWDLLSEARDNLLAADLLEPLD